MRWFGRGRGWGMGFGRGFGNPYSYCRFYPWLPRRWWAMPSYYGYYGTAPVVPPVATYPWW